MSHTCTTYEQWLAAVDRLCEAHYGLPSGHWVDSPFMDHYEAGTPPLEYVLEIMPEYDDTLAACLYEL